MRNLNGNKENTCLPKTKFLKKGNIFQVPTLLLSPPSHDP